MPDLPFPSDFRPLRTGDGSFTLRSGALDEQYHSRHGAVQESRHVFIEAGLKAVQMDPVEVLEVGLGSGLNALLTWIATESGGPRVNYLALEPYPIDRSTLEELEHPVHCGHPGLREPFLHMMGASGRWTSPTRRFCSECSTTRVQELQAFEAFDLVYFDAFAPGKQPEMWTADVFRRVFRAMRPGAVLATYCAKGSVRRTMLATGFTVERLPGPPGKTEMIRARRP